MTLLFDLSPADVAVTSDDWYTPRWVFDAAGLVFDMDVAAPVDPVWRTCPARRYLTAAEDGLSQPWEGTVWLNPPYKRSHPWIDRFAEHPSGLALLPVLPEVHWLGKLIKTSDAIAILSLNFLRPDGRQVRLMWCNLIAARGAECVAALERIAAADKYASGAYRVRPDAALWPIRARAGRGGDALWVWSLVSGWLPIRRKSAGSRLSLSFPRLF